jgi:hypothetical protein
MQRPLGNKIIYALAHRRAPIKATHEYFIALNSTGVIIAAGCGRPPERFLESNLRICAQTAHRRQIFAVGETLAFSPPAALLARELTVCRFVDAVSRRPRLKTNAATDTGCSESID